MKIIYLFSNFSYAYFEELWQLDIMFFFYRTKYARPENWAYISELLRAGTLLISIGCGICLGLQDYGLRSTDAIKYFDSLLHYSLRKIQKFHLVYWCGKFAETYSFWRVSGESPKTMRKLCLPQNFHTTKLGENTVFHVVNQTQNQISRYFDKKWRCDQVIFLNWGSACREWYFCYIFWLFLTFYSMAVIFNLLQSFRNCLWRSLIQKLNCGFLLFI